MEANLDRSGIRPPIATDEAVPQKWLVHLGTVLILLSLTACGGGGGDGNSRPASRDDPFATTFGGDSGADGSEVVGYQTSPGVAVCSSDDIKARVDYDMRDYYLYYDLVPDVALSGVESSEALMGLLRVEPDRYSYVTDDREITQLREEGITEGFGFWSRPNAGDQAVRFREILAGSPAEVAGIQRGDELIAINGQAVREFDDDQLREVVSAPTISLSIRTLEEAPRDVSLTSVEYRWTTAPAASIHTVTSSGLRIGYLTVRRFLSTTEAEIDGQMAWFVEQGVDELVVDFRYNPGGRSRVAQHLASQIAGAAVEGQIYQIGSANDKYTNWNFSSRFEAEPHSLGLTRVVVLATGFSASASEALINGLDPYIDVVVIGSRTEGKPYSSFSETYCDKSINAMSLIRTNADGVDVIGGIEPTCAVNDSWYYPQEDSNNDALFAASIDYLVNERCPAPFAKSTLTNDRSATPFDARAMSPGQVLSEDLIDTL